ncbi:hypothetical protein ACFQ7Z_03600 [Streptomyces virginiae]|uniref:hypothetical protein n=1 Tax=Streptomyces virginiae TaxID=1961 RepID=UPI0036872529
MRNTRAFKEALADTLAELARRGVTVRPGTVADTIERNIRAVATQLGIQERSAWRYFDPAGLTACIAPQRQAAETTGTPGQVGRAPMPPVDNPELALILGGVPDALEESGGDLYSVIVNVAVNARMAGHSHGEDGCTGCQDKRPTGTGWQARTDTLNDTGYGVTRR